RLHPRPPTPCSQDIEAPIGRDAKQPASERCLAPEPAQTPPRRQERLLERVLRVHGRTENPIAMSLEFAQIRFDQRPKGLAVSAPSQVHPFCRQCRILSQPPGLPEDVPHV